ncbi:unnamed protein product, partial [Effrenium voratum]
ALLSSCERVGQWQRCLRLLELQRSSRIDPDVVSYSACVSASEKAQHWTLALRFFEDLQRNVQADVISYSAAVAAWQTGKHWQRALGLFLEMPGVPDALATNAAIGACALSVQWQLALRLLRDFQR